jgi:hypothetical protein
MTMLVSTGAGVMIILLLSILQTFSGVWHKKLALQMHIVYNWNIR